MPKIEFKGPIPLIFENHIVDYIVKTLSSANNEYRNKWKLLYLGFRPHNSLKVHEELLKYGSTYPFKYDYIYKNCT